MMRFLPWTRDRYGKQIDLSLPARVLFIGESHYDAPDTPDLTIQAVEDVRGGARYRFFTSVFTAVCGPDTTPTPKAFSAFYDAVAFCNLVQEVLVSTDMQPTPEQWKHGVQVFPSYLDQLKPSHVVACSFRLWDWLPSERFSRCSSEIERDLLSTVPERCRDDESHERRGWIGRYAHAGGSCHIVKIPHTSYRGFSPTEWHPVLQSFLQIEAH